jgi:hypothetical protein
MNNRGLECWSSATQSLRSKQSSAVAGGEEGRAPVLDSLGIASRHSVAYSTEWRVYVALKKEEQTNVTNGFRTSAGQASEAAKALPTGGGGRGKFICVLGSCEPYTVQDVSESCPRTHEPARKAGKRLREKKSLAIQSHAKPTLRS